MPTDDVSNLKDVFDAIDRLCETMKTSNYDSETLGDPGDEVLLQPKYVECDTDLVSPEEVSVCTVDAYLAERWTDASSSPIETVPSDTETPFVTYEPTSDMYYTASSEVSLLSDDAAESRDKGERKECVLAGHVAAMRERFESMTRANTPAPEPPGTPERLG